VTFCPRCRRSFDDSVSFCPVDGAQVSQLGGSGALDDRNLGQTLLNQFEILDVCGRGAMGTVYRAHQRTMDRIVAVKILRRELLQEPDVVKRFVREARAAAKLQHPNIVTVHMVGETDDKLPFLVMEYIDGVSLEAVCDGAGSLGLQRAVRISRQIASALEEAHAGGIIHRDLKPANILLHERGKQTDRVKVLDFGIAKIVQPDGAAESIITRDGMIFGTPHYIAPEQATGSEVDAGADLYSLGIIMFRLVTGRLPFEGTAGMQVVLRHLREAPPSARSLNPAVPAALDALILHCLAKDRAQRPAGAEVILSELAWIEEALPPDDAPIKASSTARVPITTAEVAAVRPIPPTWRKRAALAAAVVTIAGGTALGVLAARSRSSSPSLPAPLPVAVVAAPRQPASLPLINEHVLAEDGLTLRAGFERTPQIGAAELAVLFSGAGKEARVEVALAAEHGPEQTAPARFVPGENRWRAPLTLAAGKQHVRVIARNNDKAPPLVLAFDVEPPSPPVVHAPAPVVDRAARPEPRRARPSSGDDLPVTIVPAEPRPPRAIVATPVPQTHPPAAPVVAPTPHTPAPPVEPAAYPTTKVVIDHPRPVRPAEPPPAPEQPAEDPPSRPNDPTTLPPPSPDEPR
jgi:serine/threonine-protein kinase